VPNIPDVGHRGCANAVSLYGVRTSPRRPPELTGRIFRGRDAIRAGLLTRDNLRGRAWRKVFRDVYADARLACSLRKRCLAATWYLMPPEAAVAGRSAARLYGIRLGGESDPIEVVTPPAARFGPIEGLKVHLADLSEDDVRVIDGVRLTSPSRTGWDLVQWLSLPDAVAYLDVMIARRLVTAAALTDYARQRAGQRGWRKLLRAVSLADPAAESPQESRLRVRLVQAGLPKPVSQHVIERAGSFVGRVDLAWPELRIAVEYDGRWHASPDQLDRDRARLNRLVTTDGWIILHVTARRLHDDFDGVVAEVRAAMHAQRSRARSGRPTSGI
jgi:very-short-patch-repair endonuclease